MFYGDVRHWLDPWTLHSAKGGVVEIYIIVVCRKYTAYIYILEIYIIVEIHIIVV